MLLQVKQSKLLYTYAGTYKKNFFLDSHCIVATSFRLLSTSHPYAYYMWLLALIFAIVSCVPHYFSTSLSMKFPSTFLMWELPQGVLREGDEHIEYQLLAHIMHERICLIVDSQFWSFLVSQIVLPKYAQTFWQFSWDQKILMVVSTITIGFPLLIFCLIYYILLWFIPLPYFFLELLCAI